MIELIFGVVYKNIVNKQTNKLKETGYKTLSDRGLLTSGYHNKANINTP